MVLLAIASVVISVVIKVAWLTPLLHTAAVFWFFYAAMKQHRHRWALILIIRWAAVIFVTTVLLGIFVPTRVEAGILFSQRMTGELRAWLTGVGGPPVNYSYILWGVAAFLAGSLISGGMLGFVLGSVALGTAASATLFLFANGYNVLQIALIALPPWQWSVFAAGALLLVPTARPFFDRFLGWERVAEDKRALRLCMYGGAAGLALSLLLRLALAGVLRDLTTRWTVF